MRNRYILLTAAKDEEACIGDIIESVVRQTVLPVAWFIMDDGSTDQTASIVERFAAKHSFIHLQSARSRGGRNFGSQYKAIQAAYELAQPFEFDIMAVRMPTRRPNARIITRRFWENFSEIPGWAWLAGIIDERPNGIWRFRSENSDDAVAASVVFRRGCV